MLKAVRLAQRAEQLGDRPFGCIIVGADGDSIAQGYGTGIDSDPLRHSEMIAITEACRIRKRLLEGCTLYSTHEPCIMCSGAILHSHASVVVFGSYRIDLPELFRPYDVNVQIRLHDSSHPPVVLGGVLRGECIGLFSKELANAR